MIKTSEYYDATADFPTRLLGVEKRVLLATVPRTGSNLLSAHLWRTGACGAPLEYLNISLRRHDMIERLHSHVLDLRIYIKQLEVIRTSSNGIFAVKMFYSDLEQVKRYDPSAIDSLKFDHVIYLTREDKGAQAASWAKARKSGRWIGRSNSDVLVGRADVVGARSWIKKHEEAWERLFIAMQHLPYRVEYERVCKEPAAVVRSILGHLEIQLKGAPVKVELPARQS